MHYSVGLTNAPCKSPLLQKRTLGHREFMTFLNSQKLHIMGRRQSQELRPKDLCLYCDVCRIPALLPTESKNKGVCKPTHSHPAPAGKGQGPASIWWAINLAICHFIEANRAFWLCTPCSQHCRSPTYQQESGLGCWILCANPHVASHPLACIISAQMQPPVLIRRDLVWILQRSI